MSRCPGCGGVIGRDCHNPVECVEIGQRIQQQQIDDMRSLKEQEYQQLKQQELEEYASQEVQAFKEKIRKELDDHIKRMENQDDGDPWYNGAITELTEFKKSIDKL